MLTVESIAAQMMRAWSRMTAMPGGLVFAEPDLALPMTGGVTGANLFAAAMPEARFRRDPAASLVELPTAAAEPFEPITEVVFRLEIVARDQARAYLMAGDFAKVFWPTGKSTDRTEPGQVTPGLLGVPSAVTLAGGEVWRFVNIERATGVERVLGPTAGRRTADGLFALTQSLRVQAIEHTIAALSGGGGG